MPLSISPGSLCDVCKEPFNPEPKVPASLKCGHIFCLPCLHGHLLSNGTPNHYYPDINVEAPCPLCRTYFSKRSATKLIIDWDPTPPSGRAAHPSETEARRFHDAFSTLTRDGITEPALRQLLEEVKVFLGTQPPDRFPDLKVLRRIGTYLYDTRSKMRDLKANHENDLIRMREDKDALQRQLAEMTTKRNDERQLAMRTEEDLRDYCKNLQGAYESMIRHYNFLVDEWQKLTEDNERLRTKQYESLRLSPASATKVVSTPEVTQPTLFASHREHEIRLRGTASIDPESFVISPLPEFTGLPLPAVSVLPPPDETFVEESIAQLPGTSSSHRGATRPDTVRAPRSQEMHHVIMPPVQASSTSSPSGSFTGPVAEAGTPPSLMSMPSEHHLIPSSRSRDSTDVRRSGSHPHRRRSPSRSPSEIPNQRPSPSRDQVPVSEANILSAPPRTGVPQSQGSSLVNHRLQDILQDIPVATSSSLPNMTYFPSSLARESRPSREKDKPPRSSRSPSPSKSPSSHSSYPKQDRESLQAAEAQVPCESVPVRTKPVVPDLSNAPISTASMAAQAAEKAKQERRRLEQEAERERRKGEKAEKEKADHDGRRRAESERVRPAAPGTSPLLGVMGSTVHTSSSYQQSYTPASLTYAPQRTPSSTLGRSSFKTDRHGPRALPIPIPTRG